MAAEAVKHEPRRPNLPYVFAVELRAQGLMESYQAVDVEALCAKRPNVPPKGTRWGNYYRKQILHCHAAITGIDEPFGRLLDGQKRLGLERTNDPWPKKSALHAQDRWPSPRPPPTEDAEENAPQSIKSSCIQPFCPYPKALPSKRPQVILDVVCHCRQRRTAASFTKEAEGRRIACGKGAKRNSHHNERESL